MKPDNKNQMFIDELERYKTQIKDVRETLASKYNNDMNKDVVKILRHAEHVIDDHIESMK